MDDTAGDNLELRKNGEWRTWKFIVDAVPLSTYAVWFSLLIIAAVILRFHGKLNCASINMSRLTGQRYIRSNMA